MPAAGVGAAGVRAAGVGAEKLINQNSGFMAALTAVKNAVKKFFVSKYHSLRDLLSSCVRPQADRAEANIQQNKENGLTIYLHKILMQEHYRLETDKFETNIKDFEFINDGSDPSLNNFINSLKNKRDMTAAHVRHLNRRFDGLSGAGTSKVFY